MLSRWWRRWRQTANANVAVPAAVVVEWVWLAGCDRTGRRKGPGENWVFSVPLTQSIAALYLRALNSSLPLFFSSSAYWTDARAHAQRM